MNDNDRFNAGVFEQNKIDKTEKRILIGIVLLDALLFLAYLLTPWPGV